MTNADMKPGRFLRWHEARQRLAWIKAHLAAGRSVYVCTYTRATEYKAKHADMFKANRSGLWVQRGKGWDSLSFVTLRAG